MSSIAGGDASSSSSNTRSVAIGRKVNRLLDITVNDQLWQILQYADQTFPDGGMAPTVPNGAAAMIPSSSSSSSKATTTSTGSNSSSSSSNNNNRTVRTLMEDRLLGLHQAYLTDFEKLRSAYSVVTNLVDELDSCSGEMEKCLAQHHQDAEELLSSVGMLRAELEEVRQKDLQVKKFMEQYSLTSEESSLLRTGDVHCVAFLDTLHKVRSIHRSCKDLLAANHQQAAVEIMESMYLLHVTAVERLVKHLLNSVSEVMAHDIPDVTDVFVGCVRAVRDRPAQWSKVMHEIARVRKTAVLRRYYDLLTKGNARTGRPLETLSSDVVRFFSELFAWVHQCLAEEGDLLNNFFTHMSPSIPSSSPIDGEGLVSSEATGGAVSKLELMDIIFEGLCKHIKNRLDTVLDQRKILMTGSPHAAIITFFQLDGVIGHFITKTTSILGSSAAINVMLTNGKLDVLRTFFDMLKLATQRLMNMRLREVTVPNEMQELLRVLKSMMEYMDESPVPHADREGEFAPVLGAVVDPILAMLNQADVDDAKKCVLKLNVLSSLHAVLVGFPFTSQRQMKIAEMIKHETGAFVEWSTSKILSNFGFDERVQQSPEAAWAVLQQLYSYTATTGSLPIHNIDAIQSVRLRESIGATVTDLVCKSYDSVYHATPVIQGIDSAAIEPRKLRVMLDAPSLQSS